MPRLQIKIWTWIVALFTASSWLCGCHSDSNANQSLAWYEQDLPSSQADSLLWSRFFSDDTTQTNGLKRFRNSSIDTTAILTFIDTCSRQKEKYQAQLMYSTILYTRLGRAYTGVHSMVQLIQDPVPNISREDASVLFYAYGSLLKNQERHLEAMGLSFLAESFAQKGVLLSNAHSLKGAILLSNDRIKTAQHYMEHAVKQLPHENYLDKKATLLTNLGVTYRLAGEHEKAIPLITEALQTVDSSNVDRQYYILNHLIYTWETISRDSAIKYTQELKALEKRSQPKIQGEELKQLITKWRLEKNPEASKAIMSIVKSDEFDLNPFYDQVEALDVLIKLQPQWTDSLRRHQEQIIAKGLRQLNTDYLLHFCEFTQEYIQQRITELLPLGSTEKRKECFRLIEWDRQIDRLAFLNTSRHFDIEANDQAFDHLAVLNGLDFIPKPENDQRWIEIGKISLNHFSDPTTIDKPRNEVTQVTFSSTIRHLEKEDSLSLLTMFKHREKLFILGYHFDQWTLDSIEFLQMENFIHKFREDPFEAKPFQLLQNAQFWSKIQKTVIIQLHPALETFPFALLHSPNGKYFHKTHSLFYTYSFEHCIRPSTQFKTDQITGFAFTHLGNIDPHSSSIELPGSYEEIMNLKKEFPQVKTYLGEEVHPDIIINSFSQDDVIYLATHHKASQSNRYNQSFQFKTADITSASLVPTDHLQLIVLSACETGQGTSLPGIGHISSAKMMKTNNRAIIYSDYLVPDQTQNKIPLTNRGYLMMSSYKDFSHIWKCLL